MATKSKFFKKLKSWLIKGTIFFFVSTIGMVIVYRFVPVPFTLLMLQRCIEQKIDGEEMKLSKEWVPLDKISNKLQLAVVTSEDQKFLWHHGVDFDAVVKAIRYNKKHTVKMRGGSTITQQTARNTFLLLSRNYVRKGLEVYFTALIELLWSKERIMEVYLNVIEMGDGIYGAEAAAQHYFHKPAAKLNASEAALIAACLPNPLRFKVNKPSAFMRQRQAFILSQMNNWGGVLRYDMEEFKSEK